MNGWRRRSGFSLIEILVVVALITILLGLLFPVLASSREKARQTTCLSNVKQLAQAQMLYIADHDERLPHWYIRISNPDPTKSKFAYWTDFFQPYVKNRRVFFDPSFVWEGGNPPDDILAHYVLFTWGPSGRGTANNPYWRWAGPPLALAQIRRPAETYNLTDGYTRSNFIVGLVIRHHDGINAGFLDGHAKWIRRDKAFSVVKNDRGEYYYRYISADRD
jgi:prepilin-type N-terminal cleavage/methylation domain-containing protein/prepilin-type processing-associated H-X9-DG protein